jgi:dihydrofolate reductase
MEDENCTLGSLTANGNYARVRPDHSKKEALEDFATQARSAGNFIMGRRTFEAFQASGADKGFAGLDIFVVFQARISRIHT